MLSIMASAISPYELREILEVHRDPDCDIILIDCRSLVFNSGHIRGAHQVHCPPIVKRRSGGSIPLVNIVRCPLARQALVEGNYGYVLVYDSDTEDVRTLSPDTDLYLVTKSLRDDLKINNVYFLQGGFRKFESLYSHLCTYQTSSSSPLLSSSLMLTGALPLPMTTGIDAQSLPQHLQQFPSSMMCSSLLRDPSRHSTLIFKEQGDPMQVLPWLYIGNAYHASQEVRLRELGVSALMNVAASTEYSPVPSQCFLHKNISVQDSCTADIITWFPDAIRFIEHVRATGGVVLVHCQAGISRSATICIAYLMQHFRHSLDEAFDFLKAKRHLVSPNLNFMRQLAEYESELTSRKQEASYSTDSTPPHLLLEDDPDQSVPRTPPALDNQPPGGTGSSVPGSPTYRPIASSFSWPGDLPLRDLSSAMSHSSSEPVNSNPRPATAGYLPQKSAHEIGSVHALMAQPPKANVNTFNLPLTPCTHQAFAFDSTLTGGSSGGCNSPSLTMCHSPLVSPS